MPAGVLTARIVGLFAVIGLGLGAATLLFLWATGFFAASEEEGLEALSQAVVGGIAIAAVLVFALLIGIVLAAQGGVYAANTAQSPATAVAVGGLAGGLGYVALVASLGVVLISGIDLLSASTPQPLATPVPTPAQAQSPEDRAACEEIFGAGSVLCRDVETTIEDETDEQGVSVGDLSRLGLGVIPAALVGVLTAALFVPRRQEGRDPLRQPSETD